MGSIKEDIDASAGWISRALQSSGYNVDFSPQSLWEIDRFFDEHSQAGQPVPGGLLSKDFGARIFAVGAYIGEVLRRKLGGQWVGDDNDPEVELKVELQLPDSTRCWPTQRAMKRFKNGPDDGVAAYGSALGLEVGHRPHQQPTKPSVKSWPLWKQLLMAFLIGCVLLAIKLLIFRN